MTIAINWIFFITSCWSVIILNNMKSNWKLVSSVHVQWICSHNWNVVFATSSHSTDLSWLLGLDSSPPFLSLSLSRLVPASHSFVSFTHYPHEYNDIFNPVERLFVFEFDCYCYELLFQIVEWFISHTFQLGFCWNEWIFNILTRLLSSNGMKKTLKLWPSFAVHLCGG